jgi:hypothetical protein
MSYSAVITGDIVNSTRLLPASEEKLITGISKVLEPFRFGFYRGDSFQAYLEEPEKALTTALLCRTLAIAYVPEKKEKITDVRIGIGLGETIGPVTELAVAKGEAFLLSGRIFDELERSGERLAIASNQEIANVGFKVISDYVNFLCRKMTDKQAAVIFELLQGYSQQESAKKLKKSKSTIHQHVVAGSWNELEQLIQQFQNLVSRINK